MTFLFYGTKPDVEANDISRAGFSGGSIGVKANNYTGLDLVLVLFQSRHSCTRPEKEDGGPCQRGGWGGVNNVVEGIKESFELIACPICARSSASSIRPCLETSLACCHR